LARKPAAKPSTPKKKSVPESDVRAVFENLSKIYGSADTELTYDDPFQLLVAVILSAQCTDARVNMTTPALFAKYPTAEKLAKAKQTDVEKLIHSCGFFRAKAKAIIGTAGSLVEKFGGKVPGTLDELITLRGVGRKTASVVLSEAFGVPAIAVDTHVKRVSYRLGWTRNSDPVKIEFDLREVVPMELWNDVNGLLIFHGRRICHARKPKCPECPIREYCEFYQTVAEARN
jgi:endonuclease III